MTEAPTVKRRERRIQRFSPKILAVILLAGIAAYVSVVALTQRAAIEGAGTVPTASTTIVEESEPPQEQEPSPEPLPLVPDMQRMLVSGEGGELLRATVGSCPEPPGVLEVSFDTGATWQPTNTEAISASKILHLDTADPVITRIVFLDVETCQVRAGRSFVSGIDWEPTTPGGNYWFIDPSDSRRVYAPIGLSSVPCDAAGLTSAGQRAAVLCNDGALALSQDGGASWSSMQPIPQAAAIGPTERGYAVASLGEPECPTGVRVRLIEDDVLGEPGGCAASQEEVEGQVAITEIDQSLVIWIGQAVLRSDDGGASWSEV